MSPTATDTPNAAAAGATDEGTFSLRQRLVLWLIAGAGYLLVRLIAPTLRWSVSFEEGGPESDRAAPAIYVFWHQCVIGSCWFFRQRGIRIMTSRSFDGEYIARIVQKFGYVPVRGSSSRGAVRALLGMHKEIEQGYAVAFTIDGPRGPRHVAKPGPVLLARNVGLPVMSFHIGLERRWELSTWDGFLIPKPFSRAHLRFSRLVHVATDADSAALEKYHAEMQAALERARDFGETVFTTETRN